MMAEIESLDTGLVVKELVKIGESIDESKKVHDTQIKYIETTLGKREIRK